MRNLFLLLLLPVVFLLSCGEGPARAEDQAWDKMMEVHDEVMPEMAAMNRVGRELKSVSGDLDKKSELEKVNKAVKDLEAASEGMMEWMSSLQQLKQLRENMSHEEIMDYLQSETEAIARIKTDMLRSLEQGRALLEELQTDEAANQ